MDDDDFEDDLDDDLDEEPSDFRGRDSRQSKGRQRGPRRFGRRRGKISPAYADKNFRLTYKDPDTLRRFLTEHGKIRPRRQTGLYAKDQRRLAREVKRARHLALLPFTPGHTHTH
ncbi:MAG: 30S ribosomal protein S18 [Anaerolineae bacterium]|nr:30S ribosomal protein S18 [Anaerolineae bacterium]